MSYLWAIFLLLNILHTSFAPPVDPKKKEEEEKGPEEGSDDFGLEYGRYLQEVVKILEEDKDFAKKLENVSMDKIKSGEVASELQFVKHSIRTKLDELKRIELDRLRKLARENMERQELGLDRRVGVKIPQHLDYRNPHTFEIDDLKKLIVTATKDLEKLDEKRREEFKQYEMEKELQYQQSLKNMTEEQKRDAEKHHDELKEKHKEHPKIHHPGSKPQLEQVWEEQDHMPREDFNPKTFFAMHDLNGDGQLDEQEISAILNLEVKKVYDPRDVEDDPVEMLEEVNRMREHVMKEGDKNKDGMISKQEFMDMTQKDDFEKDEGWKGLDEQQIYSEDEYRAYEQQRLLEMQRMQQQMYGHGPPQYYPQQQYHPQVHPGQGYPPQQFGVPQQYPHAQNGQYQGHPGQGMHPEMGRQGMHQQGMPQHHGVPQQGMPQYHGVPQQGIPQQHGMPQQGIPQQHGMPQQGIPQQGIPQQHGMPQQGVPPQHGMPQQGVPPQHGMPQQGGVPPQHGAPQVPHSAGQPQKIHIQPPSAQAQQEQHPPEAAQHAEPVKNAPVTEQPKTQQPSSKVENQGLGGEAKVQHVDGNAVHEGQPPKSQP